MIFSEENLDMGKDIKIMLGAIVFTFLLIIGLASWLGGREEQTLTEVMGLQVNPEAYELGNVPIDGGIVIKEYEVKNTTDQTIKLRKVATSCMCTQAKVSVEGKETRFYSMEHPGDKNPPVNLEIPSGEIAKVTVNFDPAAHGPQGTGPFDRVVSLTFSDPAGIKELTFSGTVTSQ